MSITLNGTTGIIADSPATVKANAFLDAAGGNTATINGAVPAPLASPALTGTPTAPTASVATNTTQLATTAFVLANVPAAGGMTLLGTLTTTSGTTQTLSGLTLTSYKILYVFLNGPSPASNATLLVSSVFPISPITTAISDGIFGYVIFDLISGRYVSTVAATSLGVATATSFYGNASITTASTSITFQWNGGFAFDAGSILIYGVK